MSKKLDQVHFSSTVKLDVGGQHFTTTVQTLTKDPNSILAAMFSGNFEMKPSEDAWFVLYRPRLNSLPLHLKLSQHRQTNFARRSYIYQGTWGRS